MDKVVVTGGAGFLGSHIADELTGRGFHVVLFDQRESRWRTSEQEMVIGSALDKDTVTEVINGARYVYHFSGIADIGESRDQPLRTVEQNVLGTATVIEAARAAGIERFIYASTMYVYSSSGSFYRATKQAAELIVETYQKDFNIDYTLLRYGSLYGPRAQDWNGLRKYVSQVLRQGSLEYPGDGSERREYIYVKDAARLSVDILGNEYCNKAITITGPQVLNSKELADMIFEIAGVPKNVSFSRTALHDDHYKLPPYRYTPRSGQKLVPTEFMDIGEGVLEIVESIDQIGSSSREC